MKLKTLKDLIFDPDPLVNKNVQMILKAEAIKWVKEYERLGRSYRSRIIFIKHFFNITSEDLK